MVGLLGVRGLLGWEGLIRARPLFRLSVSIPCYCSSGDGPLMGVVCVLYSVFSTVRLQIASVIPRCFTSPLLYCVSQSWGFFSSFSVVCCSVSLLCGHWLCGTVTGHLIMSSYNLFPNVLSSGMICPFLLRGLSWWLIKVVSYLLNNSACRTYHSHRWRCNHLLWS